MINLRGEKLRLFDALLDIGYIEDTSFVEGKEILPVERITALCETNGVDIADLKNETKFSRREDSVPAQQYGSWRSHEP